MLFAALIGPYFIDWTGYRAQFEAEASRIFGRPVTVQGDAKARLLPFPSVTFNDVVFGDGESGPRMTVDQFSMDAELAPFLRGEVLIFDMRLVHPQARIFIGEDGRVQWNGGKVGQLRPQSVILENVSITDGALTIFDESLGQETIIKDLDAQVSADRLAGPWRFDGTLDVNGNRTSLSLRSGTVKPEGTVGLRARIAVEDYPYVTRLEGTARLDEGELTYEGSFTADSAVAGTVEDPADASVADNGTRASDASDISVRGLFLANHSSLDISEYRLEIGEADDPYVIEGDAKFDMGAEAGFQLRADGQRVDLDRIAEEQGDDEPGSLSARLAALRSLIESFPVPHMPGRAAINLPAVLAGGTTIRDVELIALPEDGQWLLEKASAELPGRTRVEASGKLVTGEDFSFDGDLVLASRQPSGFAAWLTDEVDPSIRALKAAGFSAKARLSKKRQVLDNLELSLGGASLKGRFLRDVAEAGRSSIELDLAGGELDADALQALFVLMTDDTEGGVASHDMKMNFNAGPVSGFGITAARLDTSFSRIDDRLQVGKFQATDLAGADIAGSAQLTSLYDQPEGELVFSLKSADTSALLALADTRFPGIPRLSSAARNASLYGDADLDISVALLALTTGYSGTLRVDGSVRETQVTLGGQFQSTPETPEKATFGFKTELTQEHPARLLSQLGLDIVPIDSAGPAVVKADIARDSEGTFSGKANYRTPDMAVTADGEWNSDMATAFVQMESADADSHLIMTGVNLPSIGLGTPLSLAATLKGKPDELDLDGIKGQVSGNSLNGNLSIATKAGRPKISGDLAFDRFSLPWTAQVVYGSEFDGSGLSEENFSSSAIPAVSGDIRLAAGDVDFGRGPSGSELRANLLIREDALTLEDIDAGFGGGKLTGRLEAENNAGTGLLRAQLNLKDAIFAPFLSGEGEDSPPAGIGGTFDLTAGFESAGQSPAAMLSALTGAGVMTLQEASIARLDPDAFAEVLALADAEDFTITPASVEVLMDQALAGGAFVIDTMAIPYSVAAGIVRLANLEVEDKGATIRGDGQLDLTEGQMEADLTMVFDAGEEAVAGTDPAVSIRIDGQLSEAGRELNVQAMTQFLNLRAYEIESARVEALQATLLENQRLRREVRLAQDRVDQRERAEQARLEAERIKRDAAERLRQQRLARQQELQRAKEAAARKAAERSAAQAGRTPGQIARDAPAPQPPAPAPPPSNDLPGVFEDTIDNFMKSLN